MYLFPLLYVEPSLNWVPKATTSKDCFAFSPSCGKILTAFFLQERGVWDNDVCLAKKDGFISVHALTGARDSLFQYGLNTGGPAVMSVGWIIISFFSMSVSKTKLASFHICHVN